MPSPSGKVRPQARMRSCPAVVCKHSCLISLASLDSFPGGEAKNMTLSSKYTRMNRKRTPFEGYVSLFYFSISIYHCAMLVLPLAVPLGTEDCKITRFFPFGRVSTMLLE